MTNTQPKLKIAIIKKTLWLENQDENIAVIHNLINRIFTAQNLYSHLTKYQLVRNENV